MLRDLRLRDFRCFESLHFTPEPGLNFIIGANAQGKTSILEAACVLLRLQSPKAGSLGETVRFNRPAFGLDGHWDTRHLHLKYENALKSFALDSKNQSRSGDYLSVGRVAWIGNDDLQLVRGSGTHRRRYLDFLGAQIAEGYLKTLRAYERALRSRNALLKDNRPRREIAAFDQPLVDYGQALLDWRREFCRVLEPLVAASYTRISGGAETIQIEYVPGCKGDLKSALAASLEEESRLRNTVTGPHRDDVRVLLAEKPAAIYASEGQQRSVALALKLGQAAELAAATQTPPLYLIDDVFGELDPARRNNLMAALPPEAQKIITSTTLEWHRSEMNGAIFQLADCLLRRA